MRTIQATQTIYTFDELDDAAKERAREHFRERESMDFCDLHADDEWDYFYETELEPFGVFNAEYALDLSFCQGSGASFTGSVDLTTWIRATGNYNRFRKVYTYAKQYEVYGRIERDRYPRYVHEYTIEGSVPTNVAPYGYDYDREIALYDQAVEVEEALTEWARHKSSDLYKMMESHYWALQADDSIDDLISQGTIDSAYEFDREGNTPPVVYDDEDVA